MKRKLTITFVITFIIMIIPIFSQSVIFTGYKEPRPKRFKTTLIVVYNSLTLEEAAEKEKLFREKYSDACSVDIKVDEIDLYTITTGHFSAGHFSVSSDTLHIQ